MTKSSAHAFAQAQALQEPLAVKLAFYADEMRELAPVIAAGYDRLVARLTAGEIGATSPGVGEPMPAFLLPSDGGSIIASSTLFARGPTVLSFNRGHWCPFCRLEVGALIDAAEDIIGLGAQIVVITPETAALNKRLRADPKAPILFLSDLDNSYAMELGLVMKIDDELRQLLTSRGLDLAAFHGNDYWMLPVPATFVVDQGGTVRARFVDPDFRRRAGIDDIKAVLSGLAR